MTFCPRGTTKTHTCKQAGETYGIYSPINCKTSGVIYWITCNKCQSFVYTYRWNRARMTKNLDCRLIRLFCRSKRRVDIKTSLKHYLFVIKKYTFMQIQKGMAWQLRLPRPFELFESKQNKTTSFKASNFCFWKNAYLLKFYKYY